MRLHMNQKMPHSCYLRFVKDGTLNESLSIDQLHVSNNIYYIVHKEYKLDGSKIKCLSFYYHMKLKQKSYLC